MKITFEFSSLEESIAFMKHANVSYEMAPQDKKVELNAGATSKSEETEADDASKSEEPEADDASKSEEDKKPTTRRRGRPKKEEVEKTPSRLGRRAKKEEEEATEAVTNISDAEASKAASEAARNLTVEVVLKELHEFKVEKVCELTQEQRVEFLQTLRDLQNTNNKAFQ